VQGGVLPEARKSPTRGTPDFICADAELQVGSTLRECCIHSILHI